MTTPKRKATANRMFKATAKTVLKSPALLMSITAGVALMIGVMIGKSGGPTQSVASESTPVVALTVAETKPEGTPAIEPVEQQPRNHEVKDSLVISDNSGTVNIGGAHYHQTQPNRTPAKQTTVTRIIEVPVIREVPKRIWARPGIPANSRLGRTLATLQRFENAGVRITVEK